VREKVSKRGKQGKGICRALLMGRWQEEGFCVRPVILRSIKEVDSHRNSFNQIEGGSDASSTLGLLAIENGDKSIRS
jgi:hypothetical protein